MAREITPFEYIGKTVTVGLLTTCMGLVVYIFNDKTNRLEKNDEKTGIVVEKIVERLATNETKTATHEAKVESRIENIEAGVEALTKSFNITVKKPDIIPESLSTTPRNVTPQ